ncbi:N-succinylglutamate 5-semialdehyde dehydrogenase [Verrucomicrobia bacterium SCGC AG-212-E04]|nr:N-succinylglutamate 5-semialdehyde dehydrogenase [Verrucomicrobia bacterium SCGC AG-212-E04]
MSLRDHFLNGAWHAGSGELFHSVNAESGQPEFETRAATTEEVAMAFDVARAAFESWSDLDFSERAERARRFAHEVRNRTEEMVIAISRETGKPYWEARTEVASVIAKVEISIKAYEQRTGESHGEAGEARAVVRHRPHGVVAVLGPFNFPAHLPNGHIVPALLAGNCVIFKPSECTPGVAALMVECWARSGLPAGVLNLVQGARQTAAAIVDHRELDGLYFTGSAATGQLLHAKFAGRPDVILALEMGGNNPLIVCDCADADAAAVLVILSAYQSAGQRCTCARRLIVVESEHTPAILQRLVERVHALRVGYPIDAPEPFHGPLINNRAADNVLDAEAELVRQGARQIVPISRPDASRPLLTPGLIDVTPVEDLFDGEVFGPLLQLIRVADFETALAEANRTCFGLAAGLISDRRDRWEVFLRRIRAGVVNWNRPLTGASSAAPFGGVGFSGNHRPSAFYAADYCAYPVASLELETVRAPAPVPGL